MEAVPIVLSVFHLRAPVCGQERFSKSVLKNWTYCS